MRQRFAMGLFPYVTPGMFQADVDLAASVVQSLSSDEAKVVEKLVQNLLDDPSVESICCKAINAITGATPPNP